MELSLLEILWLWFEGTWITWNLFCCWRFVIWKRKLLWNLLWFGVKILLVWRAWDLSCWLEVHLHVSFIVIWGNESCFKICYNLKLKSFSLRWACNLFCGLELLWNLLQLGVECCEGLEICFKLFLGLHVSLCSSITSDICCDMKLGVMQGFKCVHMCSFCLLWFRKVGVI